MRWGRWGWGSAWCLAGRTAAIRAGAGVLRTTARQPLYALRPDIVLIPPTTTVRRTDQTLKSLFAAWLLGKKPGSSTPPFKLYSGIRSTSIRQPMQTRGPVAVLRRLAVTCSDVASVKTRLACIRKKLTITHLVSCLALGDVVLDLACAYVNVTSTSKPTLARHGQVLVIDHS